MLYIVRHGQTDLNVKNVLQGRSNMPLNAKGIAQAKEVASLFQKAGIHFDLVYSSPLDRAYTTGRIIAGENSRIIKDERLIEMDYGPYEGMGFENPPEEIKIFFRDFVHNPAPEGMEQLSHVVKRAGEFIESISIREEENILISTHAIAMKGLLEYLTPESNGAYWSKYIGNCGVYRFAYKNGTFTIPEECSIEKS
jgi:broad specificity phosphatase PhoE